MTALARRRGQPVLVLLLGGWVALRAAYWEVPFAGPAIGLPGAPPVEPRPRRMAARPAPDFVAVAFAPPAPVAGARVPIPAAPPAALDLPGPLRRTPAPFVPRARLPQRLVASHAMRMMSRFSSIALSPDRLEDAPYQSLTAFAASSRGGRWSADGWLLLRRDTATALASGGGSYGRSQAGGVLGYRLSLSSPLRPVAYARVSRALSARDGEFALGLSARPAPGLPLRAAAEMRLTRANGRTLARPAVYAVTELPPFELPLDFTAEAYGQAGYVGGDYASAFVDGQARVERRVAEFGDAQLSLGGGTWGGAQKGAARLDVGPSAALRLKLGEVSSRVAMDWRFRIAGDAQPSSGPALTISAGF